MSIPIIADITKKISKDYGVLIEEGGDAGIALRGLFIIGTVAVCALLPAACRPACLPAVHQHTFPRTIFC
jgi:hypothetical protein